jgi:citrate synthase
MHFLRLNQGKNPVELANDLITTSNAKPSQGDTHIVPGFGTRFGTIDKIAEKTAKMLLGYAETNQYLSWANTFATTLNKHGFGWLMTGTAAACFLDLGFHPRAGSGLFQLASAPGLLAHGLELANKPRTDMPFLDDDKYIIER